MTVEEATALIAQAAATTPAKVPVDTPTFGLCGGWPPIG